MLFYHQAFIYEIRQCVPQRHAADAKLLAQYLFSRDLFTRLPGTRFNIRP